MDEFVDESVVAQTTVLWSRFRQTSAFVPGADVVVPENMRLVFDGDGAADRIRRLTVRGTFACAAGERTLAVEGILVSGSSALFECGSPAAPRTAPFNVIFSGRSVFSAHEVSLSCGPGGHAHGPANFGEQSFVVSCAGRVRLFGAAPDAPWTRLNQTAAQGTSILSLEGAAATAGWLVGDEVAIASTGFNANDTEVRRITEILTPTQVRLNSPLGRTHNGTSERFTRPAFGGQPARAFALHERAEVANLSRRIVIRGTEDDRKGAHLVITQMPGLVTIAGVALETMGRMGELGRYPIHWHHAGDAQGDFLERSVIRNSFNRCASLHQTNNASLVSNICFEHFGHGFFLEDGNETGNTFDKNIVFKSKRVPYGRHLLISDVTSPSPSRWAPPASYWISNPDNTFTGNVAAGGEGTGFWFALKDADHRLASMTTSPRQTAIRRFENNIAHSLRHGFSIDGGPNGECADGDPTVPGIQDNPRNPGCLASGGRLGDVDTEGTNYEPPTLSVLQRIVGYKCTEYGIWDRALSNVRIDNSIFADNMIHIGLVFSSALTRSALIAKSSNFADAELANTVYPTTLLRPTAMVVYDGPFSLEDVHFDGFPASWSYGGADVTPDIMRPTVAAANRGTTNRVRGLTFNAPPPVLAHFQHDLGHYSKDNWAAGVWDQDGSLTGRPNYTLVPRLAVNEHNACVTDPRFQDALLCPGRRGLVSVNQTEAKFDLFRSGTDGQTAEFILPELATCGARSESGFCSVNHQFSYPVSRADTDTYTMRFRADAQLHDAPTLQLFWVDRGERSPRLNVTKLGHRCTIRSTQPGVTTLPAGLDSFAVQFTGSTRYETRAVAGERTTTYGWAENYGSSLVFQCVVPPQMEFESPAAARDGCWYPQSDGLSMVGCARGARTTVQVTGADLTLYAIPGPNRGMLQVSVDGGPSTTIDLYASSYRGPTAYTLARGLPRGAHSVTIERTELKNAASSGYFIVLDSVRGQ
jgi:cell migration-inducing and hyaluronan-binding protein